MADDGDLRRRLVALETLVHESARREKEHEQQVGRVKLILAASQQQVAALSMLVEEHTTDKPKWMASVGCFLGNVGWPVFILQSNVWICLGVALGSASRPHEHANGKYNMKRAMARLVPCLGTLFNALILAWVLVLSDPVMLDDRVRVSQAVTYVTWWFAVTALVALDYWHTWRAGTDWRKAMNQFSASLFLFFGVAVGEVACADCPEVTKFEDRLNDRIEQTRSPAAGKRRSLLARTSLAPNGPPLFPAGANKQDGAHGADELDSEPDQYTGGETAFTLYILAGLLPGVLAGFLYYYFMDAQFEIECERGWTVDQTQTAFCFDGQCCRVSDQRMEIFRFVAFFSGNIIAGYQIVKYSAVCLLAYGEQLGEMVGGEAVKGAQREMAKGTAALQEQLSVQALPISVENGSFKFSATNPMNPVFGEQKRSSGTL
jgi:hypothetical protein